jgi:hypothetical protein
VLVAIEKDILDFYVLVLCDIQFGAIMYVVVFTIISNDVHPPHTWNGNCPASEHVVMKDTCHKRFSVYVTQ